MTHVMRATNYGHLGRLEEGWKSVELASELKPDFPATVHQDFRRRNVPEPIIARIVDGLRKAGMELELSGQ
jgi:hypothetical protein